MRLLPSEGSRFLQLRLIMKTILFKIGGFEAKGYGFMIGIGFLLAIFVGEYRAKKKHMQDEAVFDIAIFAGLSGFLGAKLLYVIVNFGEFLKNPLTVLGSSGFVVYGGIIVGVAAGYVYTKIKKLNFMDYFDLIMPEISIAQGFGRIGCFLAGCCYGKETQAFFGVEFPAGSMAPSGVKLIPTQLFSAAGDFAIAAVLIVLADVVFDKARKMQASEGEKASKTLGCISGDIGCMYIFLYGTGRFLIEFLRNDYRGEIGFISTSQFISIIIIAVGIAVYIFNRKKSAKL